MAFTFNATFAQTKKPGGGQNSKPATPACSGAWTGSITFTRTHSISDGSSVPRVSGRGKDTKYFEQKLDYKASVTVIEDPTRPGSSIGKASINSRFKATERVEAEEENSCDKGKTFKKMTGVFTSQTEISGDGNAEASVSIGVNSDGTYAVSVGLPPVPGRTSGRQTGAYSGQCTPKEGYNQAMPDTPTNVQGASFRSNGTNRVEPGNANKISGSWSEAALGTTNTISWSLQKCGAPLRISDLKFEDMKYPNWNDWQEINEQKGTIDGNFVKIKAKVLNTSGETKYADVRFKETYKGDKWDGARPDAPLKDEVISVRVDPGEDKEVELIWDSSGYAWFDDGRPRLLQRIRAELEENGKKIDEATKNLKVAPKPLVLIHGAWSHWRQFETWQNILTTAHSYDWKAFPVGEVTNVGIINTGRDPLSDEQTNSTAQNADTLKKYIEYAQKDRNAWQVDIVAHSIGGLIARHYISQMMPPAVETGRPQIAHLLMLGTPNTGTPCADVMNFAFEMTGKSPRVVQEMTQGSAANFNKANSTRKGVKFSALAGNPLPFTCKTIVPNDGFVPVPSAHWIIKDTALTSFTHTELTGGLGLTDFMSGTPSYGSGPARGNTIFMDFVKPHVAIGPKGDHNPDMSDLLDKKSGQVFQPANDAYAINTARGPSVSDVEYPEMSVENTLSTDNKPDFAKRVKLAPKQTLEIEIPVSEAQNFGLTFMANSNISATLFDDKGTVVGKNLTKTLESVGWFRSIFYDKPTRAGTWKLKLENTLDNELDAIIATWKIP